MKKMSVNEFREIGLLQEVNRLLLHPMGLALEVVVDGDGLMRFGEIQDVRDDPEGMIFGGGFSPAERAKAEAVNLLFEAKRSQRVSTLGWHIEPITLKPVIPDDVLTS